jgi:predicted RNA-binding protein YlxR (DUF448 family)
MVSAKNKVFRPVKIPIRRCCGCGLCTDKGELLRISKPPDGDIRLDMSGKSGGRGAYICRSQACFNKALKKRSIFRTLKISGAYDTEALAGDIEALIHN